MGYNIREVAKTIAKNSEGSGRVSGSDFPLGAIIKFSNSNGIDSMKICGKGSCEYTVTRDKIQSAEIAAMGIIGQKPKGAETVACYGVKYRITTTDGKTAIITVEAGETQYKVEHIIF